MKKTLVANWKFIAAAVSTALFAIWTCLVATGQTAAMDAAFYGWLSRCISPAATPLMIAITRAGEAPVIIGISVLLLLVPVTRKKAMPVAMTAAGALGANFLIKQLVMRPRPDVLRLVAETGYAFPSGHAMVGMAFCTALLFLLFRFVKTPWKRILIIVFAYTWVAAIGFSRVYLSVHYLSDVLGGWMAGFTIAIAIQLAVQARNRQGSIDHQKA